MSIKQAITVVLDRRPDLRFSCVSKMSSCFFLSGTEGGFLICSKPLTCRQEGLAHEVLEWYICRMEGWFSTDADKISLNSWDKASRSVFISRRASLHLMEGWGGTGDVVQCFNPCSGGASLRWPWPHGAGVSARHQEARQGPGHSSGSQVRICGGLVQFSQILVER